MGNKGSSVPSCIIQALPDKTVQHMVMLTANHGFSFIKKCFEIFNIILSGPIKKLTAAYIFFLCRFNCF
jgi:hypothetical protein